MPRPRRRRPCWHNLADIVGTGCHVPCHAGADVRLRLADGGRRLLAAVISVIAMFSMMGGKNAKLMAEYQAAQDRMTKAGYRVCPGHPRGENVPADGLLLQGVQSH